MTMTKKDYLAIAKVMSTVRQFDKGAMFASDLHRIDYIVKELGEIFKQDNPRFDYAKFQENSE